MSETISGTAVKSIERALVTDDGNHMLLTYKGPDGQEANLAIPADQLEHLLLLSLEGINRSKQRRDAPADQRRVLEATSWAINEAADKRLVMTLWLPGGAEVSFVLPVKGQQEIYTLNELLQRAAGQKHASEKKPTLN